MKIMPKCTTVGIFRVWALLVLSLFRDLLLEGVWHAFSEILVPIGAPIGATCGRFFRTCFWRRFWEGKKEPKNVKTGGPGRGRRQGRGLLSLLLTSRNWVLHA